MPERSERIILALCLVAAAGHAALYLGLSLERISYPFELEWMESGSLEHVMRVLRGQSLYVAASVEFVPFPYPPVYYYVSAGLAGLLGPGFLALRAVSLLASLGSAAVIFRFVARDSGRPVYGFIAAGIFLGTWRASGLYFDVARLDSLFTFLLLAAVFALRFQRGRRGLAVAAILAVLAVLTKQTGAAVFGLLALWCIWTDWRAHGRDWATLRDWDRLWYFVLPLAGGIGLATALLETLDGDFVRYIVAVQPGHDVKWGMIGWFFWHDLLVILPLPSLVVAAWLGLLAPSGEARSREEESNRVFYLAALVGVLIACLVPRIKVGGAANNLILVHAWLVAMFGVGVVRLDAWLGQGSPRLRARLPVIVAVCALVQLLVLVRLPTGYVPSEADLRAGRALAARVAEIEGEVLMPVQGHVAGDAGKRVYAHQMPVLDYSRSGLSDVDDLLASYETAIRERRFAVVIDSNTAFLRRYLSDGLLEEHYRMQGWLFQDPRILTPVSGAQIRVGTLWVPRD